MNKEMYLGILKHKLIEAVKNMPYPINNVTFQHDNDPKHTAKIRKRIDILIGNDYYYSFLLNEKLKINEHLYLVDSIFGWICSGVQRNLKNEYVQVITYMQKETPMMPSPDLPLKEIQSQSKIIFI
ncbi:unnamed protein product [Diatraea saccharalis]|uniref:Uncharacterized protein n=1 Tax=Diatraea saccharalis TaxID=40085 RepID=A0A9N9RAW8_9NEOP|nr:unnamed protein product [Diatraea saccharalis]